jgi:hypothetical protein
MVSAVMFRKGKDWIGAVNGTRTGECEVSDAVLPARLEDVPKRHEIAFGVGVRRLEGVPDTRLRREMRDEPGSHLVEEPRRSFAIGKVELHEPEPGLSQEFIEPRLLEPAVVILVQAVHANHLAAVFQQAPAQVETDEPCGTSDQNGSGRSGHAMLVMMPARRGTGSNVNDSRGQMTIQLTRGIA